MTDPVPTSPTNATTPVLPTPAKLKKFGLGAVFALLGTLVLFVANNFAGTFSDTQVVTVGPVLSALITLAGNWVVQKQKNLNAGPDKVVF